MNLHHRNLDLAWASLHAHVPPAPLSTTTPSRNGPLWAVPGPFVLQLDRPQERVLFDPERDANPFFHLGEALWMLAGRNTPTPDLTRWVPRLATYSDDGGATLRGAYGHRWRRWWGRDQLRDVVDHLGHHPWSRRAVLGMWDPRVDANEAWADTPCNLAVVFSRAPHDGPATLNATVFARSGDLLWGVFGANAVHFTLLHEVVAAALGWQVGWYAHHVAHAHLYAYSWDRVRAAPPLPFSAYETGVVRPRPISQVTAWLWLDTPILDVWCADPLGPTGCDWLDTVAGPLARQHADRVPGPPTDNDWLTAGAAWLTRRP